MGCSGAGEEEAHTMHDQMDIDGDGFITREEWTGSPAVFDALDTDGDGILTVEEVSAGIGSSFGGAMPGMAGEMMAQDEEDGDDGAEAMLQAMLDEEAKKAQPEEAMFDEEGQEEEDDTEAMFQAMLDEEAQDAPLDGPVMEEPFVDEAELNGDVVLGEDPMGLDDAPPPQSEDDILSSLYGARMAAEDEEETEETEETDDNGDEETEEEEETEEKEGSKKASKTAAARTAAQRPRPKKTSTGVKTLGRVSKVASGSSKEINELSNLWESSPDVTDVFGK